MITKIMDVSEEPINIEYIREASEILKKGGLVAFPTETVYGLGGDATDKEASRKIYAAKGRPSDNPLIVHIAKFEQLEQITKDLPKTASAESVEGTVDEENQYTSDAPIGYDVGCQLADFETTCLDGSTFKLSDYRGKIVLINLWATYCGPCVEEMPHICDFANGHDGDIVVLAVHANLATEDVAAYVNDKGWDAFYTIDDENETIFKIVNGSLALPQTIVLNRNGEVVFNRVGSITPELLEQIYEEVQQ